MKKENLSEQESNGVLADVSGNEALRVAVAFAEWTHEKGWSPVWKQTVGDEIVYWDNEVTSEKINTTNELYKMFLAKATDR